MKKLILTVSVLAICLAFESQAALAGLLYNVDCGTSANQPLMSGAAVLGADGDKWNGYAGQSWGPHNIVPLIDSTGAASNVTMDVWNYYGSYDNAGGNGPNPLALMEDYINAFDSADGFPIKGQFAGLPASTPIQLVVYAAGDSAGQGGSVVFHDPSGDMVQTTTGASRNIADGPGVAYAIFNGTTTAEGTVSFDVSNAATWHALNGAQVQVVPEPSAIVLLVMGGVTTLLSLRKKS